MALWRNVPPSPSGWLNLVQVNAVAGAFQYIPLKHRNKPNNIHDVTTEVTSTILKLVIYFVQVLIRVRGRLASWCLHCNISTFCFPLHLPLPFFLGGGVEKGGAVTEKWQVFGIGVTSILHLLHKPVDYHISLIYLLGEEEYTLSRYKEEVKKLLSIQDVSSAV